MMVTRKGVYHHDKYLCAAHYCGWFMSPWPELGLAAQTWGVVGTTLLDFWFHKLLIKINNIIRP